MKEKKAVTIFLSSSQRAEHTEYQGCDTVCCFL